MSEEQVAAEPQEAVEQPTQTEPTGSVLSSGSPEVAQTEAPAQEPWYNTISEDIRSIDGASGLLEKYNSIDDLFKGAVNAQKMVGNKMEGTVTLPGENATESDIEAFYNKIGRPQTPDDYEWQAPENFVVDAEIFRDRTKALHQAGLTKEQHNTVMDLYKEEVTRISEDWDQSQTEKAASTEAQLRQEWGAEFDVKIKQAKSVADKFGITETLAHYGLDNENGVIDMLYQVAALNAEDSIQAPVSGANKAQELLDIKAHPAYKDKGHPDHMKLVKRAIELRS
jgi:hypothetical protein